MSKIALTGNASGTGTLTIAAPNTNSNYQLDLPTSSGTMVVTGGAQTIEFGAGSASTPSITFTGDTNTGIFSSGADTVNFGTGGSERMRVDSSGNVGIGVTPNNNKFIVKGAHVSGRSIAGIQTSESASGSVLYFGFYNSSDSRIAYVGSETSTSFQVWNGENTPTIFGTNNTERARIPAAGGFQCVNSISVGNATPTTSGAGITFPATQSASTDANTLDDYEEGTWTPAFLGSSSNPTVSYSAQVGTYVKVGKFVNVNFSIAISSISGGSGDLKISGLPFTTSSASAQRPTGTIQYNNVFSATSYGDSLGADENATHMSWFISGAATTVRSAVVGVTATTGSGTRYFQGSFSYIANA